MDIEERKEKLKQETLLATEYLTHNLTNVDLASYVLPSRSSVLSSKYFAKKLWSATRFVHSITENSERTTTPSLLNSSVLQHVIRIFKHLLK